MQIYIHVPFCVKKCHYCSFYSLPVSSLNILEDYKPSVTLRDKNMDIYEGIETAESQVVQKKPAIQSLSAFLTGKEIKENPAVEIEINNPKLTLADALFSKEQAKHLKEKLGIAENTGKPAPKKIQRLKLPKEFCQNLNEKHPLQESSEFKLWKKTILKELGILSEFYGKKPITSIFFGGGTPSFIPLKAMEEILFFIIGHFAVLEDCEITLEANPESINNIKAIAYKKMGFNRVSLGVQTLDGKSLEMMGRPHTALQAQQAYFSLRSAGFGNISLDFIWATPQQKLRSWVYDIKNAIKLGPEHISAYNLTIEPGSYFDLLNQEGKLELAGEQEQAQMYKTGAALLEEAGYMQYEISNFAKMGYQCRHNLGYWTGNDYIGAGPAAASTVGNIRRTHTPSLENWAVDIATSFKDDIKAQTQGKILRSSANYVTEKLTQTEQLCELVMLSFRTSKGLSLKKYQELNGQSFMKEHQKLIELLNKNDLLRIKNGHAYLTKNGMLVSNSILEYFFRSIKENRQKLLQQ